MKCFFSSNSIIFKYKNSSNVELENSLNALQLKYFYVHLNKIVLTQTNPEIIHTFKLFIGSVELFICLK